MDRRTLLDLISIPLFTGVIGYITNWTGVIMLFQPMRFHGLRIPGLRFLYPYLPRRVQVIPAVVRRRSKLPRERVGTAPGS